MKDDEFLGEVKIPLAGLLADAQAEKASNDVVAVYPLGDPHTKLSKRMKKQVFRRSSESLTSGSNEPFGRIALSFRFDTSSNGHRVELVEGGQPSGSPQAVSQWSFALIGTGSPDRVRSDFSPQDENFVCKVSPQAICG